MTLERGARLGPYEVEGPLGAGGMGEVYRARDARLQREVAIKALPTAFAGDTERLARFEREARMLASLNHPNIAGIYGLEEVGGLRYLALELVPGETLAARLERGSLSVDESIDVCRQVASALETAHESGIIHRDLKPGNVMLTPDDAVKVLDFGLAKTAATGSADSEIDLSRSPTVTFAATSSGTILGTAAYMSPEQARGKEVDRRADIWSFGCVLYECLTGRQAFGGETVSDLIATILQGSPDWEALPEKTPPSVRHLLQRCLEKDPRRRLRDAGDARLELEEAHGARVSQTRGSAALAPSIGARRSRRSLVLAAASGILVGGVLAAVLSALLRPTSSRNTYSSPTYVSIGIPDELRVTTRGIALTPYVDVSPDGSTLVIGATRRTAAGTQQRKLYVRRFDHPELRPLEGTEGVSWFPRIAGDGRTVLFVTFFPGTGRQKLFRVPIDGSAPPTAICELEDDWNSFIPLQRGEILFVMRDGKHFIRLSASGQVVKPRTSIEADDFTGTFEIDYRGHSAVLDESHVFCGTVYFSNGGWHKGVAALDVDTGIAKILLDDGGNAIGMSPGRLLFTRGENVLAAPFDLRRLEISGVPQAVFRGIRTPGPFIPGKFDVTKNGTLVYVPGGSVAEKRTLTIVDFDGNTQPWSVDSKAFNDAWTPDVSADGRTIALVATNASGIDEIWAWDIDSRYLRRLVAIQEADVGAPALSADGQWIAYRRSGGNEQDGIYVRRQEANGEGTRVYAPSMPGGSFFPLSWAPDRSALLFRVGAGGSAEIHVVQLTRSGEAQGQPQLLIGGPESAGSAQFSPDGRWVVFESNRFGNQQLFIASYEKDGSLGAPVTLTRSGTRAWWAADGRSLFYSDSSAVKTVSIVSWSPLHAVESVRRFDTSNRGWANFTVLPDGRILAIQESDEERTISRLEVVFNWSAEVERLMASPSK